MTLLIRDTLQLSRPITKLSKKTSTSKPDRHTKVKVVQLILATHAVAFAKPLNACETRTFKWWWHTDAGKNSDRLICKTPKNYNTYWNHVVCQITKLGYLHGTENGHVYVGPATRRNLNRDHLGASNAIPTFVCFRFQRQKWRLYGTQAVQWFSFKNVEGSKGVVIAMNVTQNMLL